jgi:hypothetical protein
MAAIIWRFHSSGVRKALCGVRQWYSTINRLGSNRAAQTQLDSIVDARPHAIGTHKISAKNLPHNVIRAISAVCNSCHLARTCVY